VLVFFAHKAYTIDDSYFLFQARHVLVDPVHPSAFDIQWFNRYGRASELSPTGPGMAYILTPVVALGAPEWAARVVMYLFLSLATVGLVRLGLRFGLTAGESVASTLLLISFPAVMGMAGTSMPDIPAMAMGLWAMERWVAFLANGRWLAGGLAALLMCMAILTRTHAVMLLAVCPILLGLDQDPGTERLSIPASLRLRRLWPLALAVAFVAGASALTRDPQGGTQNLLSAMKFVKPERFPQNLLAFFSHLVLVVPVALAWLFMRWRCLPWKLIFGCSALAAALLPPDHLRWWWVIPVAGTSAAAMLCVLTEAWRRGDLSQLALAIWVLTALPITFYEHLPSKYLVLSAPACALLIVIWSRTWESGLRVAATGALCGTGLLLAVLIMSADARLADLGRQATEKFVAPHVEAGGRIYYCCDWSSWYADSAGARPLLGSEKKIKSGDLIMSNMLGREVARRRRVEHIGEITDSSPGGRVVFGGAGFYSNSWGYLPWMWGNWRVDRYELWKVR